MALVRDPYFWKRFSTAVHQEEESKSELECATPIKEPDSWLERERRKRKRSLIWGFVILFGVILLVTGGVIVWWLAKHNWLQKVEP
ncbi:hypothetical protein PoHVEF18_010539 [Penicillium ochrochloron]